ncbi:serine protease [uncultured Roseibium sp.]|uniref:S1 family peptidase n=1 Tax=uncultured Roseibium sp. TaxID=1936171 RepID=UPI00261AB562|nr:serine protease [uncultured Roseibium sp.]
MLKSAAIASFIVVLGTHSALADKWVTSLPGELDLKPRQLFRVTVEGKASRNGVPKITETGTGFAIAPGVVITAKHVTRTSTDFHNLASSLSDSAKIHLPARETLLEYPEDHNISATIKDNSNGIVTESPFPGIDAARIDVLQFDAVPLPLSACEIEPGATYYLLKNRQLDNSLAKNLRVPVAVKLTAGESALDRMGALRVLVHDVPNNDKLRPARGDSGAPIVDEQGRVVGFISAIRGKVDVLMTPTRQFFDLIPDEIKSEVSCNTQVTFANFGVSDPSDPESKAQLLNLVDTLFSQTKQIEVLRKQNKILMDQVADLIKSTRKLEVSDGILAKAQQELESKDIKQDKDITALDNRGAQMVTAIALERANRDQITTEHVQTALEAILEGEPVVPAVKQMRDELGEPRWGFVVNTKDMNGPRFTVSYERSMTLPVVTSLMGFCLRPMLDLKPNHEGNRLLNPVNYGSESFYNESADRAFKSGQYFARDIKFTTECKDTEFRLPRARSADYAFAIGGLLKPDMSHYDDEIFEIPSEGPKLFFGYTFDAKKLAENEHVEHEHRFVFEVKSTSQGTSISCYYFPHDKNRTQDSVNAIVAFLENFENEEVKANRLCETL